METLDRPVSRRRHLAIAAIHLAAALFFGWLFYERYWEWRECIEAALSSCVTPDGENLTVGGVFWAIPAMVFLAFAIRRLVRARGNGPGAAALQ